jgi:hypothetical protein
MKLYFRYIRDFSKAQMRLQEFEAKYPELKDFLAKVTTEKTSGLGLMAFLIMPVQRLPRYEMLLRVRGCLQWLALSPLTHLPRIRRY